MNYMVLGTSSWVKAVADFMAEQYLGALNWLIDTGNNMTMLMSPTSGGVVGELNAKITGFVETSMIPAVQGVAYAIAVLFFIISLIELATQDRLTVELFVKFFSKIGIAIMCISLTDDIFRLCFAFGDALSYLFNSINLDASATIPLTQAQLSEAFQKQIGNGLPDAIAALASTMFSIAPCYIVGAVLFVITYIVAFTRILELTVRGAFLPIAVSLMADDGWRGAAGRYIKKFMAICSQSAVLIVIGKLATYAISFTTSYVLRGVNLGAGLSVGDALHSLCIILGIAIASVGIMFKSIGMINDVFGA